MTKQHELPSINLTFLKRKTLLAIIFNSIKGGDNYLFRNAYAKDEKSKEVDILENGKNSCAAFVSWILLAVELIKRPHTTVEGTEKDLVHSGWYSINERKPGTILIWEKKISKHKLLGKYQTERRHMGFYIGNSEAVSNDSKRTGFPHRHHYTYNGTRKIEKIYWHPLLDKS